MMRNILIICSLFLSASVFAQSAIGSYTGSGTSIGGRTDNSQAQAGAINSFISSNPNSDRTTVIDQGGGVYNISSGGKTYIGVTELGTSRIVGSDKTVNCVNNLGVVSCQ